MLLSALTAARSFSSACRRTQSTLALKLGLSVTLTAYFCVPYFALQAAPVFPARTLPLTWVDRAIAFSPGWVWVYQSVYLLIAIVPWLATDRGVLLRYARGFVLLSSLAFACFLFVPVAGPRPDLVPTSGMFAVLVSYDTPLNAFPSLHCGLAVYTALLASEMSRGSLPAVWRRTILALLAVWVVLIAFATLATKQHYVVDLPPGMLLAWLCHRWAWRRSSRRTARSAFAARSFSSAEGNGCPQRNAELKLRAADVERPA